MRQFRDRVGDKTVQLETEQGKTIKYRDRVGKDETTQRQSRERQDKIETEK